MGLSIMQCDKNKIMHCVNRQSFLRNKLSLSFKYIDPAASFKPAGLFKGKPYHCPKAFVKQTIHIETPRLF